MPARCGELALRRARDRDRLGIRAQLVEGIELVFELLESA